jgi:hypothetical protein
MAQHCDPDVLALRALGERTGEPADDRHLAGCARCQGELDQLRAVVATAREVTSEDAPEEPPARVWDAVAAEVGLDRDGGARPGPGTAVRPGTAERPDDSPGDRVRGRRSGLLALAAAAVVGLLVGVGGTLLVDRDAPDVVASATLTALPDRTGEGTAAVVWHDGERSLDVAVSGLSRGEGFYEVWLLDADAGRLVPVGLLRGGSGRFALPDAVDVAAYPVVDISIEPADGDPAHSGDSVVRGRLQG